VGHPFGLDFSGYTTVGGTCLAKATVSAAKGVRVEILNSDLLGSRDTSDRFEGQWFEEQRSVLAACLGRGYLAVDVPIDLQGLPFPSVSHYVWELTLRPVDRVLRAMPAFASFLGAPVVRFHHLAAPLRLEPDPLGTVLFETYPAGSLSLLPAFVGEACVEDGHRQSYKGKRNAAICQRLAQALGIALEAGVQLSDDQLDAVICALTALPGRCEGEALLSALHERLEIAPILLRACRAVRSRSRSSIMVPLRSVSTGYDANPNDSRQVGYEGSDASDSKPDSKFTRT
jgi:hypothetical protein